MKFIMPNKNYGVYELFHEVAKLMGKENDELNYNCRCINVAENLQDGFFTYYREENLDLSETEYKRTITALLAIYGPKVDAQLAENEVEVFEGFIC